jgi:hypothetical protein
MCCVSCSAMHIYCTPSGIVSTATSAVSMVVSMQETVQCVTGLAKHNPIVTVQHSFCHTNGTRHPISKALDTGLTSLRKVELWKSANHLDPMDIWRGCRTHKTVMSALSKEVLVSVGVLSWVYQEYQSKMSCRGH